MREEILFITHKKSDQIIHDLKSLRDSSGDRRVTTLADSLDFDIDGIDHFKFDSSVIEYLDYPMISDSITPGHVHFPLFYYFLKQQPKSDFYWMIEYDVRFTGDWSYFFDSFKDNDRDFLAAHIKSCNDEPGWPWWKLEHPEIDIPLSERLRSFNPIIRISKQAMTFLNDKFISGWKGHNEVLLVSLLKQYGYTIGDFNEESTSGGRKGEFYTCKSNKKGKLHVGTHRHKPPMNQPGFRKNMLYHPVKEDSGITRSRWVFGNALRNLKLKLL